MIDRSVTGLLEEDLEGGYGACGFRFLSREPVTEASMGRGSRDIGRSRSRNTGN